MTAAATLRSVAQPRSGRTVLVVDDEPTIAEVVARYLERAGYETATAGDGLEALRMAADRRPDLIVLDVMLPGRNGYRVCGDLRRDGNTTPILMLTAKDGHLDEAEALDTGADDYLTKPFSFAVLVAHIRALLRRTKDGGPAPVSVGDVRLDPVRRRVWRGTKEVSLTAREFEVLEFLVRRCGQVLSKQAILDGVWDIGFDGDPNIVEVYVRRLRRKLDEPHGRATIVTLRGAGYRMESRP
jgi:two-component system, OmpR family, response regulator